MHDEVRTDFEIVKSHLDGGAPDLLAILDDLGVSHVECVLPDHESGAIEVNNGRFTVFVNQKDGPQRKRFTIAHEIGHYILHRDLLEKNGKLNRHADVLFGNDDVENPVSPFRPQHEVQANQFAAALLMPKISVERLYNTLQGEPNYIDQLAGTFKVSKRAMRIRLANLGLEPLS